MKLDLHEIANWSGAKLPHSEPNPSSLIATGYSIDSRTLQSGDLFFAVKGERFDGNDFVLLVRQHIAEPTNTSHDKKNHAENTDRRASDQSSQEQGDAEGQHDGPGRGSRENYRTGCAGLRCLR